MLKSIAATFLFMSIVFAPITTLAQQDIFKQGCAGQSDSTLCKEVKNTEDPLGGSDGILTRVVDFILISLGVASVIMIIIGGFKYVVSGGDAAKTSSAKNTILYAIIGLIVALAARPLIKYIVGMF